VPGPTHAAEIAEQGYEQEKLEAYVSTKIHAGEPLWGNYPPGDELKAEYIQLIPIVERATPETLARANEHLIIRQHRIDGDDPLLPLDEYSRLGRGKVHQRANRSPAALQRHRLKGTQGRRQLLLRRTLQHPLRRRLRQRS